MHTYNLYINDKEYEIGIAELNEEELDRMSTIVSKDYKTGIILKTKSGNVPLDAKLLVEQFEVTEQELKHLTSLGYKNLNSYNLKLYSKILDKGFALVETGKGRPITSAETAMSQTYMELVFSDGKVTVQRKPTQTTLF